MDNHLLEDLPQPASLTYKMPSALWAKLSSIGSFHSINRHEHIFTEKEPALYAYIVLEGCICIYSKKSVIDLVTVGDSIGTTIISKNKPGQTTDKIIDPLYPLSAKALVASQVLKISLLEYNQLVLADQDCALYTLEQFRKKMHFVQSMKCFESFSVNVRLANFLLKKTDLLETRFLTKKIIGHCAGISEATVIRQFSEWSRKKILKVSQRKIDILNRDYLESLLQSI